jgi:hypothetical protein
MAAESSTIQFYAPRAAADVLDIARVHDRARAAGIASPSYQCSTFGAPPSRARITCRLKMAQHIIDEFLALAEDAEGQLLFDLAVAADNGRDAMDPRPPRHLPRRG